MLQQRGVLTSPLTAALAACAAAAVLTTVLIADGMAEGPGTMGTGLIGFLGIWIVMMAAMMLPSVSPVAWLYLRRMAAEPRAAIRALRTFALVVGYLAAWAAYGVIAFMLAGIGSWVVDEHRDQAPYLAAAGLATAGVYQLTPLKNVCLSHCRSPLSLFLKYSGLRGATRDFRVGLHHGGYCVGCCWGLMVVLVIVGVMNIGWMTLIAVTIAIEKLWRRGRCFGIVVGVALLAFAIAVPANPGLVPGMHPSPASEMDM